MGGTIPVGDQVALLGRTGFERVAFRGTTGFRTSPYTVGALFSARKDEAGVATGPGPQ